mgnify:CR=1 FL=1
MTRHELFCWKLILKKSYRKKSFWKIRVAKLMLKIMFCIYLLTILDWLSILLMNEPLLINEPCKLWKLWNTWTLDSFYTLIMSSQLLNAPLCVHKQTFREFLLKNRKTWMNCNCCYSKNYCTVPLWEDSLNKG